MKTIVDQQPLFYILHYVVVHLNIQGPYTPRMHNKAVSKKNVTAETIVWTQHRYVNYYRMHKTCSIISKHLSEVLSKKNWKGFHSLCHCTFIDIDPNDIAHFGRFVCVVLHKKIHTFHANIVFGVTRPHPFASPDLLHLPLLAVIWAFQSRGASWHSKLLKFTDMSCLHTNLLHALWAQFKSIVPCYHEWLSQVECPPHR